MKPPDPAVSEFCWCCARWMLTRPATGTDGVCDPCRGRSPSACDRAHIKEAQGGTPGGRQ